jgi:hypothetical protein
MPHRRSCLSALVAAVIIAIAAAPHAPAQSTATVTGVVRDAATNAPLAGVTISVTGGLPAPNAQTDATGAYRIELITPGDYWIRASKLNYVPEYFDNVECLNNCILPPKTTLGAGTTFVADFALTPLGTISGTVTDADGVTPLGPSAGRVALGDRSR